MFEPCDNETQPGNDLYIQITQTEEKKFPISSLQYGLYNLYGCPRNPDSDCIKKAAWSNSLQYQEHFKYLNKIIPVSMPLTYFYTES